MRTPLTLLPTVLVALLLAACTGPADQVPAPAVATDSSAVRTPQDGMQEITGKDGALLMRGPLKAGLRDGEWTSYFPDGRVRSRATFVNGLQEGTTEVYHGNAALYYRGQYHRDKPVGEWMFYDSTGVQQRVVRYDSLGNLVEQR